jgi:2-polyprenyl-3-methyl-5-hydroxy-6-metoxy-1,4-benzoquinol methylase
MAPSKFFNRLNITPGMRLLDIACGAGQLTIPAAVVSTNAFAEGWNIYRFDSYGVVMAGCGR